VIREVVRAVDVTPLAGAPRVVEGLIDYRGTIIPVFSLRRRFELPDREMRLSDVFIIADTGQRTAALHVDAVDELSTIAETDVHAADELVHGGAHIAGAATLRDGLVLLHDVATFLSAAEADTLNAAMASRVSSTP
jgi:purine-binding chemotaxis protein CheW